MLVLIDANADVFSDRLAAALGRDSSSPLGRVITKQEKKVKNVSAERM